VPAGDPPGNPRLAPHGRLAFDRSRGTPVLLAPETVTTLNETGAAITGLCDGTRTVERIAEELRQRYERVDDDEVRAFIARLGSLRCLRAQP
jgi:pyrroloquinoline quinone biosynthesis protein D